MSISLQDFNNNFKVQIRTIGIPHRDSTGIIPAAIGFNIICLKNNRVQYFESHIQDTNLISSSTTVQILDYAWNDLKASINSWAAIAINETNLIGYVYVPTSDFTITFSNLDLSIYNADYTTKILRFDVYPPNDPNCWFVGFSIYNNINQMYMYIDTKVPVDTFNVTQAELDIMNQAWDNVKNSIGEWASEKLAYSSLINTNYTPGTI
jgi:hypothetical protein